MIQSAGLLVFRRTGESPEVLLTHPGGPIWGKRDSWSIPKGELGEGEDHRTAAFREFDEEVGIEPPAGTLIDLGEIKQRSDKINFVFALEGDLDITKFVCHSTFTMEWPPHSGVQAEFPENDRAAWFDLPTAKQKLFKAQTGFIDRLAEKLAVEVVEITEPEQQSLL